MSRLLKKSLYGVFYLAIIVGIGFGVYRFFLKPAPSCFDGIQDQGETGVDCGGPCAALCTAQLTPIQAVGIPSTFAAAPGNATFLGQIENSNGDFGAENISYQFQLFDTAGNVIGTVPGETFVYPDQSKYVAAVNVAEPQNFSSVQLVIASGTPWTPSSTMGNAPQFTFENVVTQSLVTGTISVSGEIVNPSSVAAPHVTVIALFKNQNGVSLEVSQTEIDLIPAGSDASFSVTAPSSPSSTIDLTETEVDAYSEY